MAVKKIVKGQSLFEVTVTLMIVSLVVTAIAGLALISIKSSSYSRNKTLTTRYIQEANEWIKGQKDTDWNAFLANVGSHGTLCFQSVDDGWYQKSSCLSTDYIVGTNLIRQVSFDASITNTVMVNVTVSWSDQNDLHQSSSVTYLTNWQDK
jgi:Tfp pilus assembly protein PilV